MTLKEFFEINPRAALGFSGGVDSSYLLYAGLKYGADIQPYYIKTAFQPSFEFADAKRMALELGAEMTVIELDVLSHEEIAKNPKDRCFFCKKALFGALRKKALSDGYTVLLDGTNASDDAADRPGMKALAELNVLSPLREAGLTKDEIRRLSKEAGLFTWNKPAYACLATRIPAATEIDAEKLKKIEGAEDALFSLGFSDFRVRYFDGAAKIQLSDEQFFNAFLQKNAILDAFVPFFDDVFLDLKGRG